LTSLEEDTLDIQVSDKNVCVILDHIKEHKIDAIFTHWHGDTHPPHIAVNRMVLHAARNVSTVLGFEVNWHLGVSQFSPNFFVPLSDTDWKNKINAYKLFESEVSRAGDKYLRFHDCETQRYGLQVGRERAEGFYAYKFSLVL
jgi:LmbE family N-acetylglucosaminyl deacetylase